MSERSWERIVERLSRQVDELRFAAPVTHVYNPLDYARPSHLAYLETYADSPREIVLLGMNPGPWGMAQTGVPFGEVAAVREWMGIDATIGRPENEHPKRPVLGLACPRSEVSGRRLWGWARERFGTAEAFFRRFAVANYCPLSFMEASWRNVTPDKLPATERAGLYAICDEALCATVERLAPALVIGIGRFAEQRAVAALSGFDVRIGRALHPSPASPAANRGWAEAFERDLHRMGVSPTA